jgi:hypothetical protein
LHADACIKTVIATTSIADMPDYEIDPTQLAVETSFSKFTQAPSDCGPLKYKVSTASAGAQAVIGVVGSTNSNLISGVSALTFEDSATIIKLKFGTTNDLSLVGVHTFKIEATLANWPEMDNIMMTSGSFSVEVKAACLKSKMIQPNLPLSEIIHAHDKELI